MLVAYDGFFKSINHKNKKQKTIILVTYQISNYMASLT
jgi:hypothetical protein